MSAKIKELYKIIPSPQKIITDTRLLKKGDVFWAIRGENFDGNNFVQEALNTGAAHVVCEQEKFISNSRVSVVKDSLLCLQEFASYHRQQLGIPVIAVTGTNGKTTTKELIFNVLRTKYQVSATQGNFNNHLGVPLSLLQFTDETEIGIIEMGANHVGEIAALCKIAKPDYGIITNIGKAHLEGFGSFEGVIQAKTELYNYLKNKQIVINRENEILKEHAHSKKIFSYGISPAANLFGELVSSSPYLNIQINKPKQFALSTQLTGKYNFENILAAAAFGFIFNVSAENIALAVQEYKPDNNRSQIIEYKSVKIIADAYNANPASMIPAINNMFDSEYDTLYFILGDMLELGEYAQAEHVNILEHLRKLEANNPGKTVQTILAGKEFQRATDETEHTHPISYSHPDKICTFLKTIEISNAQMLIKGSRSMELEKLLPCIKNSIV
ncbi:MAG: UDP-N-acetylmuramoyl-tripeptide--D-alanyl-D-alanine ligase [Bacteroidota bacterium]|nr:UDP-N-acetylmuramoyl-tripeptide--D-alanyl-D-alanine ligase [Bacteroidota bacterium]